MRCLFISNFILDWDDNLFAIFKNKLRCSDIVPFHCFCRHGCHKSSGNTELENIVVSQYCPI